MDYNLIGLVLTVAGGLVMFGKLLGRVKKLEDDGERNQNQLDGKVDEQTLNLSLEPLKQAVDSQGAEILRVRDGITDVHKKLDKIILHQRNGGTD